MILTVFVVLVVTASQYIQSVGLSGIVTYFWLYIGLVLFIACAAVWLFSSSSEASDNARAYQVLAELGAEGPCSLASICPATCAMPIMVSVIRSIGNFDA